jgi:dipeptidyl aminopeptidase/acylaminoacyl peptidase
MKITSPLLAASLVFSSLICFGQSIPEKEQAALNRILAEPTTNEIDDVLSGLRQLDLSPKNVVIHDTIELSNSNRLFIMSHTVEGSMHYGAIVTPRSTHKKLRVVIFATGGDGMHKEFDVTQDFNHKAIQFPAFLGEDLDSTSIVVIPSFRGQQLLIGKKQYQSEGNVTDAFVGATTDALGFLNVVLKSFKDADEERISIFGGSRGGTVALLASARDKRISKVIAVAAPTDVRELYLLYPDQFKLLFFNDMLAGKVSESVARKKFIACSPIHFAGELAIVQLHHDKRDPFVPIAFATKLANTISVKGGNVTCYVYDDGIHGFWDDVNFWERVHDFIR